MSLHKLELRLQHVSMHIHFVLNCLFGWIFPASSKQELKALAVASLELF